MAKYASGTKISTVVGNSKKVKIEDLYKRFKSSSTGLNRRNLGKSFDENTGMLTSAKIKEVFDTGIKPSLSANIRQRERPLMLPPSIIGFNKRGFKRLADITDNDFVGYNGVPIYQRLSGYMRPRWRLSRMVQGCKEWQKKPGQLPYYS